MPSIRSACWALALAALASAGCTSHEKRASQIREVYYAGGVEAADQLVLQGLESDRLNADVLKLERAMIHLSAGRPAESEQLLREVRDRFDALEEADITEAALSYLADDRRRAYAGEDYEKVLVRGLLALSNLFGDGEDAEAYCLQLIDKQEQIIAEGADRSGTNPKVAYQRVALAPYLQGMLREASHVDYLDAQRSYTTVVSWQPTFAAGKNDLQRASSGRHSAPGHGVLYVFALTGRGPYKQQVAEIPTSASLLIAGEIISAVGSQTVPPNVAPVKVPQVVAQVSPIQSVSVVVGNRRVGTTETITNVTQLAIEQYQAVYPRVIARAVARRCLKKGMIYGAKDMTGIEKGSLTGLAFDLAGVAWEATESADTRCWALLPEKIQVLRIELPAGEHDLVLEPVMRSGGIGRAVGTEVVPIADGRNTYVLATFPDTQLVGKVLVSQP